jgi:transketolase
VIDGHDMGEIVDVLDALPFEEGRPSAIVSKTVKGHGVSMSIHQHMNRFDEAQMAAMLAELGDGCGCQEGES